MALMFLVRSGAIEGYEKLVIELGGGPLDLMREAGLEQSQFRNPNTYISYSKMAELLEITALACRCPLFGLLLARRQTSTVLGELPVIMSRHRTAGEAITAIGDTLYLHAKGAHLRQLVVGDDVQLEIHFEFSSPMGLNQLAQMSTGHLANFTTELLNLPKYSLPLLLRQLAPGGEPQAPADSFYSRLQFDSGSDGIRFPHHWLQRKSHWDEAALRRHLGVYLSQLQQRYPDRLTDQVREIIGASLPSGECSIERVAATLDLHPRVLQKRLKSQKSGYSKLLQETRQDIAQQHLRFDATSITQLALDLGYADIAVFSRNFRQWTGQSPSQWRKRMRDSAMSRRQSSP